MVVVVGCCAIVLRAVVLWCTVPASTDFLNGTADDESVLLLPLRLAALTTSSYAPVHVHCCHGLPLGWHHADTHSNIRACLPACLLV